MTQLTHLDSKDRAQMVNVGEKAPSVRTAAAEARVRLPRELAQLVSGNELHSKKGPVFQTAVLAGVMGAKRTSDLIPLCHPLPLEDLKIEIEAGAPQEDGSLHVRIVCTARTTGKTGVEMEALTGASVAALTLYDMGKAVTHGIVIEQIRLLSKSGGKRDFNVTP